MAPTSDPRPLVALDGRLLAYRGGGIPRYVRGLVEHLPRDDAALRYALVVNRRTALLDIAEIAVHTPPHHRIEPVALGAELSLRGPALVHATDVVAPHTPRIPRVCTIHDLAFLDHPEHLAADAARYYRQVGRAIGGVARVIAVSETTRRRVIERLRVPPERVQTVYHGVDRHFLEAGTDAPDVVLTRDLGPDVAETLLAERPVILAVGTVEPRKRHALLVAATSALAEARPDAAPLLVVAGPPGWQSQAIEAAISALSDRGFALRLRDVSDAALVALYRSATMLAVPSLDEGFGLPAVEAMACGLPVVVANRGALPEVVGDTGLLVEHDDAAAWAGALATLLDDAALREHLAARGRERASMFRWETTAARTAAIYREVLAA